ncbi:NAD(P)H-binding protein [Natronoglycomyces albus]|uniref:NAD(P)H-binding protein n=1 Tax=Natronoglycomyces albus TaxID=2811108 RepID=A0A895XPX9_9ACTN|nr:NAD(P)H-binding protein [Natronoglycomyces albus]QSB05165.1 NAD(P)H-binding protein [Natronoglycomyces albus]
MSQKTFTVIGGTGKTGRRVVAQLRGHGHQARPVSRSTDVRFDWDDADTWASALENSEGVYIMQNDADDGTMLRGLVAQAQRSGVKRLVLLSAREWVDLGDDVAILREQIVRQSGMEWTILRPVWFAQNFSEEPFISDDVAAGELRVTTGDGRHPFIDAEDIAAVAVAALTEPGHHGQIYELTGPRALTFAEALAEISQATGQQVRHVHLSDEEYLQHLTANHYPEPVAEAVVNLARFIREGKDARLSDGVRQALGRAPRDFSEYVRESAAARAWSPS